MDSGHAVQNPPTKVHTIQPCPGFGHDIILAQKTSPKHQLKLSTLFSYFRFAFYAKVNAAGRRI